MVEFGYPIEQFSGYCRALSSEIRFEESIRHLVIDTRHYRHREGSVFFAIRGPYHDGHSFVEDIYRAGMRNFVVSDAAFIDRLPEANVILVEEAVMALQHLAAAHRHNFDYPVIAITGSNGKTVVKEWLFQLLHTDYRIARNPKSYNSQVGVPLAVWSMRPEHNLAIFEAGISKIGEMQNLQAILKPDIGIFTNIGDAHQENFPDLRAKVREKLKLFEETSILVYCRDQVLVSAEIERSFGGRKLNWSTKTSADLRILEKVDLNGITHLRGVFRDREVSVEIPFTDEASIENICQCWVMLLELGIAPDVIAERMRKLSPIAMRLEQLEGFNRCTVINDTYNSDINSLEIALDFLRRQGKHNRKTAIVSDIVQSGESPQDLYGHVASLILNKGIDRFIGIGPDISAHHDLFSKGKAAFFPDTATFLSQYPLREFVDEDILVKGARAFAFERIVDVLQRKSHETVLEIDLAKVVYNLNYVRSLLPSRAKIMAVVKAFAYGSGSYEVARLLEYNRVEYLAVAYTDEGVALRSAGIDMPILVLNPEAPSYATMIAHRLEPLIYGFRTLSVFKEALKHNSDDRFYPVHVKIDTGMHRLGFDLSDMDELAKRISSDDAIEIRTVFSHLVGSERPDSDHFTAEQVKRFHKAVDVLKAVVDKPFDCHILNSAGVIRHPEATMDMVRVGLALHGLSSAEGMKLQLEPVARLMTVISQIRTVSAGEGVGYAPRELLNEMRRIAVLPVGYADGLRRSLGHGRGKVFIAGHYAPFIGSICMDMAMVDITDIPCSEGDHVEIFGPHISVYDMAESMETIPYEVLTGISPRVKRVFLTE